MKRVLITGANSYIGTSFEKYIKTNCPDEYEVCTVDMVDGTWRETDFLGYDCVFHVAGIAHQKETKENAALYYKINRDLAIETAKKAKKEGVRQFVFLSSMSVYGMDTGIITKSTLPNPKSHYGKSKFQAEKAILELADETFVVTILRPPMVYGAGCKGNFNSVERLALKLPVFPNTKNQRSMIYIDNLTAFLKMSVDDELDGIYMPQNKEYMNTCDMAKWVAEIHNKKLHVSTVMGLLVKILIPFADIAKKGFGSLIYHADLEDFNFSYCAVDLKTSVKYSVIIGEKSCEK